MSGPNILKTELCSPKRSAVPSEAKWSFWESQIFERALPSHRHPSGTPSGTLITAESPSSPRGRELDWANSRLEALPGFSRSAMPVTASGYGTQICSIWTVWRENSLFNFQAHRRRRCITTPESTEFPQTSTRVQLGNARYMRSTTHWTARGLSQAKR